MSKAALVSAAKGERGAEGLAPGRAVVAARGNFTHMFAILLVR